MNQGCQSHPFQPRATNPAPPPQYPQPTPELTFPPVCFTQTYRLFDDAAMPGSESVYSVHLAGWATAREESRREQRTAKLIAWMRGVANGERVRMPLPTKRRSVPSARKKVESSSCAHDWQPCPGLGDRWQHKRTARKQRNRSPTPTRWLGEKYDSYYRGRRRNGKWTPQQRSLKEVRRLMSGDPEEWAS